MSATHPRLTAVVEPPLYEVVEILAHRDRVSLSQKVRDLLLGAVELSEDAALDALVHERRKLSKRAYALSNVKRRFKLA